MVDAIRVPLSGPLSRYGAPDSALASAGRRAATPSRFERVYLAAILTLIIATPFLVHDQSGGQLAPSLNPLRYLEHQSTEGNAHKQMMLAAVYASCGALLVLRGRLGQLRHIGLPLGAMLLWTLASTLWSVDPSLTLRRCAAIDGLALVGVYAALRFGFAEMLRVMAWVAVIGLVASLVVAVLLPEDGLDYDGRLRGVLDHKNDLGGFAALSLLVAVSRLMLSPQIGRLRVLVDVGLGALAVTCLFLAHSATPIAVLMVAALTLVAARLLRNAHETTLALSPLLLGAGLIALVVFVVKMNEVAPVFGRDTELSGRTLIWQFALRMVWAHPLSGYGYGAFWSGSDSPGSAFWYLTHVAATHAHNGYLQVWLDVGLIGLALIVSAILTTFHKLGWLLRHMREPFLPWAFAQLAFICATNISETTMWGVGNSLQTALLVYVIVRANVLTEGARGMLAALSAARPQGAPLRPAGLVLRPAPTAVASSAGAVLSIPAAADPEPVVHRERGAAALRRSNVR